MSARGTGGGAPCDGERGAIAATYQVQPPEQFNFSYPGEWPKWARRFERFRKALGLADNDEESQANTLVYAMGDEADDILRSFGLSADDAKIYDVVKGEFDSHFIKRRNVIYEQASFNQRRQEAGESVDCFVTALYGLAEHCYYAALHDEMIRDRIVVGLRDAKLSESLQLDPELTLEKAVTKARQAQAVKQQQPLVRGSGESQSASVSHRHDRLLTRAGGANPIPRNLIKIRAQSLAKLSHLTRRRSVQPRKLCVTSAKRKAISTQFVGL